jgi:DNA-binding beta-propeller fold protein YncE
LLNFKIRKELPEENECEFDHADVDQTSGRVFVAHTSSGTVEVLDGKEDKWIKTIPDCAGGSGVVFDPVTKKIFAASRAEGHILAIDPVSLEAVRKFKTGKKPNGLAVDGAREILMTADVGDNQARFHNQKTGEIIASVHLSGRPRWSTYRKESDEYIVNIMDPPGLEFISAKDFKKTRFFDVDQKGPHGLVIEGKTAFVACDDATLVTIDLKEMKIGQKAKLEGAPDVLWYNRKQDLVYCSIGEPGVVQVFNGKTLEKVQEIRTEYGSHTLTFDEKMQKLYTFLPESHSVGVYK